LGRRADEGVEHALLGLGFGLSLDLFALRSANERDADLDQIAHDLLDVPADIANLGELGRLDLEEGGLGELGESAGNLGLAHPGRADHQDVLGQHLFTHGLRQLLPAPAVAEGDGDGALGVVLADDEPVELGNDFAGGEEGGHVRPRWGEDARSSTLC
jgi:hypothetical protein